MAKKDAIHPEDLELVEQIKRADRFSACLHLGPHNRHTNRDLPTYQAALDQAAEFNKLSRFGRRTVIYAINKLGSFPVDEKLARLAGLV